MSEKMPERIYISTDPDDVAWSEEQWPHDIEYIRADRCTECGSPKMRCEAYQKVGRLACCPECNHPRKELDRE